MLASGQRLPHKNWTGLIRALALLDEEVRPQLVITGARGEDPLRPLVDALGMHDWVTLKGWVDDDELAALKGRARAMAMPTLCEGFGLPVLEAMSIGLPVLASDIPVLREVGGDAALWFDPRSTRSIADALSRGADPARADGRAERGRARAGAAVLLAAGRGGDARGVPARAGLTSWSAAEGVGEQRADGGSGCGPREGAASGRASRLTQRRRAVRAARSQPRTRICASTASK